MAGTNIPAAGDIQQLGPMIVYVFGYLGCLVEEHGVETPYELPSLSGHTFETQGAVGAYYYWNWLFDHESTGINIWNLYVNVIEETPTVPDTPDAFSDRAPWLAAIDLLDAISTELGAADYAGP